MVRTRLRQFVRCTIGTKASKTRLRDVVYVVDLDDGRMKTRPPAAMCHSAKFT